ncbi:MAG TPA: hypothetical protein VGB20_07240 [bacterium]
MSAARRARIRLWASLAALYALPYGWNVWGSVLVGAGFALIVLASAGIRRDAPHLVQAAVYLAVSTLTYRALFQDEVWAWLPWKEVLTSPFSFITASVVMAASGAMLLLPPAFRARYWLATVPLHAVIALSIAWDPLDAAFTAAGKLLGYRDQYTGSFQTWQFIWLLTYFLPVFFWCRPRRSAPPHLQDA